MTQAEMEAVSPVEQGEIAVNVVEDDDEAASAPASDGDEVEGEAESEEQPQPKQKSRLEQRFSELTGQRDQERARAEEYQRELRELRQQLDQQRMQEPLTQHQAQEPNPADFESLEEFRNAYRQWTQQAQAIQQQATAQAQIAHQVREKLQDIRITGAQKYSDFDAVISQAPDLSQHAPFAFQALLESKESASVAYELAKNPSQVLALSRMNPMAQAREIWAIEQRVSAQPKAESPQTDPPHRVNGGPGPVVKDPDQMSTKEWLKWRNKHLANRRR